MSSEGGRIAFLEAIRNRNWAVAKMLISRGMEVASDAGQEAFLQAACNERKDVLKLLIEHGVGVNSLAGRKAFLEAVDASRGQTSGMYKPGSA